MALWNNIMTATSSAYAAFKFSLQNPGEQVRNQVYSDRLSRYRLGWNAYTNGDVFASMSNWLGYANANGLNPITRTFYNPVPPLVDFNASHVYQGVLSTDGRNLPKGELLAIPLAHDTPDEVRAALGQLWQWGNWAKGMDRMVVFGASMGDVAIEAVEDVESGRCWPQVIPAAFITSLEFDERENVIYYEKEYKYHSRATGQLHTYKKIADRETIREFRDDKPFDYGNGTEYANTYGFAPLVFVSHRGYGSLPGAPAIMAWDIVERLNSLATYIDTAIRVQAKSPTFVLGKGLTLKRPTIDGGKTSEDSVNLIFAEGEGSVMPLNGNLNLADAEQRLNGIINTVEQMHPEIVMYNKLREMSDVSGKAVELLMGDVKGRIRRTRTNYDEATTRIFKMLITIGGIRAHERKGGWSTLSPQQEKFLPFDINSYGRGEIDFEIQDRPLVPKQPSEYYADEQARYAAITSARDLVSLEYAFRQDGADDEGWLEIEAMRQRGETAGFLARNADAVGMITE